MKKKTSLFIVLVIIFCIAGCMEMLPRINMVSYGEINKGSSPKPKDCEIEVFRSDKPEKSFTELGIVSVGSRAPYNCYYVDQLQSAKNQACTVGADALIDIREAPMGLCVAITATIIKWE